MDDLYDADNLYKIEVGSEHFSYGLGGFQVSGDGDGTSVNFGTGWDDSDCSDVLTLTQRYTDESQVCAHCEAAGQATFVMFIFAEIFGMGFLLFTLRRFLTPKADSVALKGLQVPDRPL